MAKYDNRITKPCLSPCHPFKQKTYKYDPAFKNHLSSPNYCISCMHLVNLSKSLLQASLMPHESLYGEKQIQLTREQALDMVNDIYDDWTVSGV